MEEVGAVSYDYAVDGFVVEVGFACFGDFFPVGEGHIF